MIMGATGEDLQQFESFQVTGVMTGMFDHEEDRRDRELNSAVVVPGRLLKLGSTGVVILKLTATACYGQSFMDVLYTTSEIREIAAFTAERRRHEKLAGKLAVKILASEAVRRWFGARCPLPEIQVLSPSGPPRIGVPENNRLHAHLEQLYFSLSHAGDLVCAAVSRHPVGVDVEQIRPLSEGAVLEICEENIRQSMADYRQGAEGAGLAPEALPIAVFTQKEAVLKASGVGIIRGLAGVELSSFLLGAAVDACCFGERYRVLSIDHDEYFFSLAERVDHGGRWR
jgi:phosphopantetheinyl transferase